LAVFITLLQGLCGMSFGKNVNVHLIIIIIH
jgi:hypothetical protein